MYFCSKIIRGGCMARDVEREKERNYFCKQNVLLIPTLSARTNKPRLVFTIERRTCELCSCRPSDTNVFHTRFSIANSKMLHHRLSRRQRRGFWRKEFCGHASHHSRQRYTTRLNRHTMFAYFYSFEHCYPLFEHFCLISCSEWF